MTHAMPLARQAAGSPGNAGPDEAVRVASAETAAATAGAAGVATGIDGAAGSTPTPDCPIVLVALSHPALGDIGIDDTLFAIGRTEPPFDRYPEDTVADLSRRHARIFSESGLVHVADMGSKNGTAVNGIDIRQKTARLQDGDELRFGRTLCYRVRLHASALQPPLRLVSLTLEPQLRDQSRDQSLDQSQDRVQEQRRDPDPSPARSAEADAGLEQIVVRTFPFLVSKTDATFARYRLQNPQQLNYLSRRHAHVFLRRGMPFVEDLGSTNGTFVNGKRLDEHAVPLADGDTLAFGGRHFVYRVRLQQEVMQLDATLTRYAGSSPTGRATPQGAMQADAPPERTTFIVAPDSFLDIFCLDQPPSAGGASSVRDGAEGSAGREADQGNIAPAERDGNAELAQAMPRTATKPARVRQAIARLAGPRAGRLMAAMPAAARHSLRRAAWIGVALCLCVAVGIALWYTASAPQRQMQALLAAGQFRQAAALAASRLRADPEQPALRALATDTWLKAYLPPWMAALQARDTPRVDAAFSMLRENAAGNLAAVPLIDELALIGWLERTVAHGPGAAMQMRLFADEDRIGALLEKWERDPAGHQLRAAEIGAAVPAFRPLFATALSDLRRLQSDSAVTLAAIARLKTGVADALAQERPEAIAGLIAATAEKAPRLTGMEALQDDLRRYLTLERARREARLGPLVRAMDAGFRTPPFSQWLAQPAQTSRLPPAPVVAQMRASADAWSAGQVDRAQALLDQVSAPPWVQAAAAEAAHRRALLALFATIDGNVADQRASDRPAARSAARNANGAKSGQAARAAQALTPTMLAERLDPQADAFLLQRLAAQPGFDRAALAAMARTHAGEAQQAWQQYRDAGPIDPADLAPGNAGPALQAQAALLARADEAARQAQRDLALAGESPPAAWLQTADAIALEEARLHSASARAPLPAP